MAMMTGTRTAHDAGRETVVVQVEAGVHLPDAQGRGRVHESGDDAPVPAEAPAIGASVVPNSAASTIEGSEAPWLGQRTDEHAEHDRNDVPAVLAEAANPTIVKIAPMTGPLRSPPTSST